MAHGFRLSLPDRLEIKSDEPQESTKGEISMRMHLKGRPETASILLTTDQLKTDSRFENYSHKWLKEYANYGFEINRAQKLSSAESKGWLVDFFQKTKGQQVRQIILNHDSQIAIITCMDDAASFAETAKTCAQIFKDFSWIVKP